MGQRSQIYVRLKDKEGNKYLIAKYFQWNYGERMISRAKYGIEYCKNQINVIFLNFFSFKKLHVLNKRHIFAL